MVQYDTYCNNVTYSREMTKSTQKRDFEFTQKSQIADIIKGKQ